MLVISILILFIFVSCEEQKEKPPKALARVGDSFLFENEVENIMSAFHIEKSEKRNVIQKWVEDEVYFNEAKKNGIVEQNNFQVISNESKKNLAKSFLMEKYIESESLTISRAEIENYYEKHSGEFFYKSDIYVLTLLQFKEFSNAINFRNQVYKNSWRLAKAVYQGNIIWSNKLFRKDEINSKKLQRFLSVLKKGEITAIISESDSLFSIYRLEKFVPANTVIPIENIEDEIISRISLIKNKQKLESYKKEIYSKYQIEIYEETK